METSLKTLFLFSLFESSTVSLVAPQKILYTTSGIVEGVKTDSPWGSVNSFYGIPYAAPPTAENRFRVSQPLRRIGPEQRFLAGRVNSLTHPPPCPQILHAAESSHRWLSPPSKVTQEDCLKLNVFIPSPADAENSGNLSPVLVIVPGSALLDSADSHEYDASALTSIGRIIVITLNYRVGVFGFLSTGNETIRGNAGISDILSALEWVGINAATFGGDKRAMTVAGINSGSMLLSAILTSPRFRSEDGKRKPLAQRMILHGGVTTGRWSLEPDPMASFEQLIQKSGCIRKTTILENVKCLQNLPEEKLLEVSTQIQAFWKPVIDNALILRDPLELIEFGQYPVSVQLMIGENSGSGSLCYSALLAQKSPYVRKIETDALTIADLSALIRIYLREYFGVDDESLTAAVLHEYLFAGVPENSFRDTLTHFCGTLYVRNPMELLARYASRFQARVFRYEFSHHPASSQNPDWLGAPAGDETPFLFPTNTDVMTLEDVHVFQNFSGSWMNFVRKGMPNPSMNFWPAFDEETKDMIVFTFRGMKLDSSRFLDRDVHFWRETFKSLRTATASCSIYKSESLHNLCSQLELPEKEKSKTTDYFAVFLISLSITASVGVCVFV